MSRQTQFRYPCTGPTQTTGFPEFLGAELGAPRRNLRLFAAELAGAFGVPEPTLVNSGSSANLAAAIALAEIVGPGANAVVAGFTFPSTVSSLLSAGFSVTVADTQAGGFCLDPHAFERLLQPDTRLVCVTHFLGFPDDLRRICVIARSRGIKVLVDACETMDIRVDGRQSHEWADAVTWSFYHPHHLSAFGGGAVLTADAELRRIVESVSHWGRACTCHYDPDGCGVPDGIAHYFTYKRPGHNLELSELNACFGRFQLASFTEHEVRRKANYAYLRTTLENVPEVRVWTEVPGQPSPFVFPIQVRGCSAAAVGMRLGERGVEVRTLMGGDICDQPAYRGLTSDGLANCRRTAESTFFVGIHQSLPEANIADVATILREELLACG